MAETRAKTLGDLLDAIRVAVDATLNRNVAATREQFETATASAIGAFEAKSQQQIEALSQHADAFERNFSRTTAGAIDHAEARTEALRGSLEAIRVAVDETLSSNIAETQARFEQAAEAAINGLLAQTATIDHNFVATTSQAADSISQRVTDAHKRFSQVASEAIAAIGVHGDRVNETLAERLDAFEATMLRGGDEASNSIGYHGEMLSQQIGASLKAFETHLDDSVAHTRDRLAQHTERFNADFVGQLASLEALMRGGGESSADHIQAQTELLRDVLADNLRGFEKIVSEIGGGAAERIDAQVAALEALMRDGGASSADHIRTQTEILRETLADNLHGFERVVSEIGGGASERISAQIASLENLMRDGGQSSADHIRTQTEHLRDTLAANLREFEKVASEIGGGASERIGAQIAALEALMQDGGASSADHIRTQTEHLRDTLADNLREFEKVASEIGGGASERIGAQIAALEDLMKDGGASSADYIRTQTETLRETLADNLREFERLASEIGVGASRRIGAQIAALEALIHDGGANSADQIRTQTKNLRETLAENLREFERVASELGGGASRADFRPDRGARNAHARRRTALRRPDRLPDRLFARNASRKPPRFRTGRVRTRRRRLRADFRPDRGARNAPARRRRKLRRPYPRADRLSAGYAGRHSARIRKFRFRTRRRRFRADFRPNRLARRSHARRRGKLDRSYPGPYRLSARRAGRKPA